MWSGGSPTRASTSGSAASDAANEFDHGRIDQDLPPHVDLKQAVFDAPRDFEIF
jgi:hypothetical protein